MTNEQIAKDIMGMGKTNKCCTVEGEVIGYEPFEENLLCVHCSGSPLVTDDCSLGREYTLPDLCPHWKESWHSKEEIPDFLNDHNAALMVVEKMREDGYYMKIESRVLDNTFEVTFYKPCSHQKKTYFEHKSFCVAVSTAALKAKGN